MPKIDLNLEKLKTEREEIQAFLSELNAYSSPNFSAKNKRFTELEKIIERGELRENLEKNIEEARELASLETGELAELAKMEIVENEEKLASLEQELFEMLLPKDPNDEKNVIVEIRAGAGGDEASLFASELYRMYLRYCEQNSLKTELLSESANDAGGYKEVVFGVKGDAPYSKLKFESGVHRVQRVPDTEASGRIHTSTASVSILPEVGDVEININPADVKMEVFRASGAGGQHVNKTSSAVRLIHIPTGMVAECQTERSQFQNRDYAMKLLQSKLYEKEKAERDQEIDSARRSQIGNADRSEKIRTYNYPQGRITDHRIGFSVFKFQSFLDGDLDEMIDNLITADTTEKLKNS